MFEILDDFNRHISTDFNKELENLCSLLLKMGSSCEIQLGNSLALLEEFNSEKFDNVIAEEQVINAMELKIDENIAEIIARRQPIASDLRLILVVSKIVRDVERVGDEAHKIGKIAKKISDVETKIISLVRVNSLGEQARKIFADALTSFVRLDTITASEVMEKDSSIDLEYKLSTKNIISLIVDRPELTESNLQFLWVLRSLERIGDHAKNIAEQIIYLVNGTDIRHPKIKNVDQLLSATQTKTHYDQ